MNLEGKIALVTGAGRGIGRAIATMLANESATVISTGFSEGEVNDIIEHAKENNLNITGLLLNVTDAQSRENLMAKIKEKFGVVHILINNAGITKDNLILRMKDDEWDAVIDTNLNSIFHMTKLCLRDMVKERWGRIVSISSVVGAVGNPGQANYATAKAGLVAFSKSLAQEIASRGITVNAVAPGFVDTFMTQQLTEAQKEALLQRVPIHRMGTTDDIAFAVKFLTSPEASYITGQTIHVNGGMYMV